jgi:hypothetical protein
MNAAATRRNDVVEPGKVPYEKGFRVGALRVEPAVCHGLAATGLVSRIDQPAFGPPYVCGEQVRSALSTMPLVVNVHASG